MVTGSKFMLFGIECYSKNMIHDTNIMLEVDGILQNTVAGFFYGTYVQLLWSRYSNAPYFIIFLLSDRKIQFT